MQGATLALLDRERAARGTVLRASCGIARARVLVLRAPSALCCCCCIIMAAISVCTDAKEAGTEWVTRGADPSPIRRELEQRSKQCK